MMKKKLLLALSVISILNAEDMKTTILEVINTNPIVLERLKNYNSTKEDVTTARSGFYPKIDISLGGGVEYTQRKSNRNNAANDGKTILDIDGNPIKSLNTAVYQNTLTYTQNIFKGWQTTYQVEEQQNRTVSAAFSYIENVNDIAFKTVDAYLQVLKQKALLDTAKEDVAINEEILGKVQKLYDSGLTTLSEANKIKASLALAKSNKTVQENTLLDKMYGFQRIFGRYMDPEDMEMPELHVALPASIEDAAQYAMDNNPSLLVEKYNVKLAQATYKEKKSPFYPSIDVELSASMTNNLSADLQQSNSAKAMVYLRYNLFNGFNDTATLQKSISQLHQEVQTKDKVRREVIEGLNLSWASNEKIGNQLEFLRQYRDFAQTTLDLYSKEYDLGRRSLLDLSSAQADFIASKNQIINAEFSVLYAKYRILDAMGILVDTVLGDESNKHFYAKVGIASETPENNDTLPIPYDIDKDLIVDEDDICNNSLHDQMRNTYGCKFIYDDTKKIERYTGFTFDSDDLELNGDGEDNLEDLITQLQPYGFENLKFDLFGNIAEAYAEDMNASATVSLTQERNNFVKKRLLEAGALEDNIVTHPMGENSPMYSDETSEGKELNNRVDIAVRKLKK